ncbi:MAG: hypothetical protein IKV76_08045, partial [Clostridia bacterium]|nr:hypothetical protein [Clostridia bacterium]
GKNVVRRIIVSVVCFAVAAIISAVYYSNRSSSGDAPETSYEQIAVDYVNNITGSADAQAFINSSAVDFEAVYSDMIDYFCTVYSYTEEDYFTYISETYDTTITSVADIVNADVKMISESLRDVIYEEFATYTVNCTVAEVKTLQEFDLSQKFISFNSSLAHFGKNLNDYIDTAAITEAYEINIETVFDSNKVSSEYTNVDNFYVTVAKVNGEYKVLFDDYLIEIMLDSITEETE